MTIRDLVKDNSAYGSISCIKGEESVSSIRGYLSYNFDFIKGFKTIILAVNWLDGVLEQTVEDYLDQWRMAFPNSDVYTVRASENIGHTLSTMDLDNTVFNKAKDLYIKWLFKSTEDVLINSAFLDKEILQGVDFYYFNGFGYAGFFPDYNYTEVTGAKAMADQSYFYPQTNFYIINTESIDYLYNEEEIDEAYKHISKIENYSGRIWEYLPGFSCEGKLAETIKNQGLTSHHLIPEDKCIELLRVIKNNKIVDGSHKNIMIEGVCHFHNPEKEVIIIS